MRADRLALLGRQLLHDLRRDLLAEPPDHLGVLATDFDGLHPQPRAHPVFGDAAALVVGELVVGDPEQPADGRRLRSELRAGDHRRGERLGRQVGRGLGVEHAALEERQQRTDIAVVEPTEVLQLAREQQRLVRVMHRAHAVLESCDRPGFVTDPT